MAGQGQQIAFFVWQDLARVERFTEIETVLLERSQQWLTETGALVIELKKQGRGIRSLGMASGPGRRKEKVTRPSKLRCHLALD